MPDRRSLRERAADLRSRGLRLARRHSDTRVGRFVQGAASATWGAARSYGRNDDGIRAAGIAYYALLSFFPLVLLVAAVTTKFLGDDPAELQAALARVRGFVPGLRDRFWGDVAVVVENRSAISLAAFGVLFFLASRVTVALEKAMRRIFGLRPATQPAWSHRLRRRLRAYVMTLVVVVTIGVLFLSSSLLGVLGTLGVDEDLHLLAALLELPWIGRRIVPVAIVWLLAYQLFRHVPPVRVRPLHALIGSAVFLVGHEVAAALFSTWYSRRVANFDVVYGSFVGVIALAIWVYWLSALCLFAAGIVAELSGHARLPLLGRAAARHASQEEEARDEEHGDDGDR